VFEYFSLNTFTIIDFQSIYKESIFRGFSGNKNIMATFLLLKLPVSFYLYYKSSFKKSFLFIPFFIVFFITVFLLNARASFLSLSIILLLTLLYYSYNFRESLIKHIGIIFSFISSYVIFTYVLFFNSADVSIISEVNSIEFTAKSSSHRFLLWDNALSYIYENPFFGAGIGNWKIESAPYWKTELSDFIVPYHAHNDFLELTTELGVIGGLTYLFIFIFIFIYLIKPILKFSKASNFHFLLFSSFSIYFIDASLNFPMERTIIQILFAFFLALFLFNSKKVSNE
jgi:O-antigen ligase